MADAERLQGRKAGYKKSVDPEEARRKREEHAIQIRKQKKHENERKKRHAGAGPGGAPASQALAQLPALVAAIYSNSAPAQLEATSQFRKLLSIERNPPIDEVINSGAVPKFIEFLTQGHDVKLQFEAAWALTNIASGASEHTKVVIEHGAIPLFVGLLASPDDNVREQAVWALGNIAGDSHQCRDLVLEAGALAPLLAQLNEHAKLSFVRNGTWTLSNFCRGKPPANFNLVAPALPVLANLIFSQDTEVLTDALWALSYISDGNNDRVQAVIEAGVTRRVVELLVHPKNDVAVPALRTIGNIVTGDDIQTQVVINAGCLPSLLALLTSSKKNTRKEAAWTVSNVMAGNKEQIQAVMDCNIVQVLISMLESAEFEIKKEAAWALSNATSGGTPDQLTFLVQLGAIGPLSEMLNVAYDSRIVTVALEGIENILRAGNTKFGPTNNHFVTYCDEVDVPRMLEDLQLSKTKTVCEKAASLLLKYFGGEEVDEEGEVGYEADPPPAGDAAQQQQQAAAAGSYEQQQQQQQAMWAHQQAQAHAAAEQAAAVDAAGRFQFGFGDAAQAGGAGGWQQQQAAPPTAAAPPAAWGAPPASAAPQPFSFNFGNVQFG